MARQVTTANVCDPDRMNIQRMAARIAVASGGLFWAIAAFSGERYFHQTELPRAIGSALVPLAVSIIVFGIGWLSDRVASAVLYALSTAALLWGFVSGWDAVLWALVIAFLVAPMTLAGTLHVLAARMESTCGGAARAMRLLGAPEASSLR